MSSLLDFIGLQYVSAGIERLILFIYPTMVLLISAIIFKINIKPYQWLAVAITYIGLLLAFYGEINFEGAYSNNFYFGELRSDTYANDPGVQQGLLDVQVKKLYIAKTSFCEK